MLYKVLPNISLKKTLLFRFAALFLSSLNMEHMCEWNKVKRVGWSVILVWRSSALPLIFACVVTDGGLTGADTSSHSVFTAVSCLQRDSDEREDIWNILHVIMRWLLAGCCGLALINISGKYKYNVINLISDWWVKMMQLQSWLVRNFNSNQTLNVIRETQLS